MRHCRGEAAAGTSGSTRPAHVDVNQQREQYSRAFLQAIASPAGYSCTAPTVDDDSIDVTLSGRGQYDAVTSPRLDVQLKCTSTAVVKDGAFSHPLPKKNYDDLRATDRLVPAILVVVRAPAEPAEWTTVDDAETRILHSAYWQSLRGRPETTNTTSVTISIPVAQRLSVAELQRVMAVVGAGGTP